MKDKVTQRSRFSLWGYFWFFVQVVFIVSLSILVYAFTEEKSGGNALLSALVTLANILVMTGICTLIDYFRRKFMVERPVKKILEATQSITKGDFSVRVKPFHAWGKYDEYDVIAENLNIMAEELSKSEILRSDFVVNVSHEMKTPLAVLLNYTAALEGENDAKKRKEYCEAIVSECKRLTRLINNVLKLSKLENQQIFPQKVKLNLGESLRKSLLDFLDPMEQKEIEVVCNIDDVDIVSDESFLEIIWSNLLSNAVKFTPKGGKIAVTLKKKDGFAVVKVKDSGCGMNAQTGARIFEKFYQGDRSHAGEGNGLGLALVKKVIEVLGGEIAVESEEGKGSEFFVKLRV